MTTFISHARFFGTGSKSGSALVKGFARYDALFRQRQKLASLDDHLLADIGITREAAVKEAKKLL